MATENLFPDGSVFSITGWTGTVDNVDEAPDGSWLVNDGSTSQNLRASFPTPTLSPTTGANLQTFRAYCRKNASGGGDPTISIGVRETGGSVDLATGSAATITSTTGEWVTFTWDASLLATSDGSAVEIHIDGSSGGGGPNRRFPEIDSIEWVADTSAPAFTGTIAATLADTTGALSGTHVAPVYSGAVAAALDDTTGSLSGTVLGPQFTGSLAVTLDDVAGSMSGSFATPVYSGTLAATLDDATGTIVGTFVGVGNTGAIAATLEDATGTLAGTTTPPTYAGALVTTLEDATGSMSGTVVGLGHTGTIAATLDGVTGALSGTFLMTDATGTVTATLDDVTGSMSGTVSNPSGGGTETGFKYPTVNTFGLMAVGHTTYGLNVTVEVLVQPSGGGAPYTRRIILPPDQDLKDIPYEQLLREDEELIALVVAAIHEGIIP